MSRGGALLGRIVSKYVLHRGLNVAAAERKWLTDLADPANRRDQVDAWNEDGKYIGKALQCVQVLTLLTVRCGESGYLAKSSMPAPTTRSGLLEASYLTAA